MRKPLMLGLVDEVADRAEAWYARIWRSCSDDEKLVLSEIAAEGFVNYKSRTVRRLMARGLAVKDPSFRLMNQTFRRFVLSAHCQHDIRAIEGAADPSPWDRFRAPFLALLVVASLFFVLTQQELFTATITTLTTVLRGVQCWSASSRCWLGSAPSWSFRKFEPVAWIAVHCYFSSNVLEN